MEKGSNKALGILFVIILIVLLVVHLVTLRNVRQDFSAREKTMTEEISKLKQQVEALTMENRGLNGKLQMRGIAIEVVRNNFGSARELLDAFHQMLVDGGCKKLDQLNPLFEEMQTNLLKKKDVDAMANLEKMEAIIFGKTEAAAEDSEVQPAE